MIFLGLNLVMDHASGRAYRMLESMQKLEVQPVAL